MPDAPIGPARGRTLVGPGRGWRTEVWVGPELRGRHDVEDPFHTTTVVIGWADLLRALIYDRRLTVTVKLDASMPTIAAVMGHGRPRTDGPAASS